MLKRLWKRGEIAPEEQFLLLSTIFCYLMLDFYVKTGIRFSLRDKRLFEITEVEITRVDCISSRKLTDFLFLLFSTVHYEGCPIYYKFLTNIHTYICKTNIYIDVKDWVGLSNP